MKEIVTPEALRLQVILRSALAAILADGVVDPSEIEVVQGIFLQVTGEEVSEELLQAELQGLEDEHFEIGRYLQQQNPHLDASTRTDIIRVVFSVMTSDGSYDRSERSLLTVVSHALGMSENETDRAVRGLRGIS